MGRAVNAKVKGLMSFSFCNLSHVRVQPTATLTLLEQERELRLHVLQLEKTKHDRMKAARKLKRRDQSLCDLLCATPYYIPTGVVPSEDQVKELEEHVNALDTQKVG